MGETIQSKGGKSELTELTEGHETDEDKGYDSAETEVLE